jgi:hypothetical protein
MCRTATQYSGRYAIDCIVKWGMKMLCTRVVFEIALLLRLLYEFHSFLWPGITDGVIYAYAKREWKKFHELTTNDCSMR